MVRKQPVQSVQIKKKPGRPRNNPPYIPVNGISNTPNNTEHVMELNYCEPMVMKRIMNYMKNIAADNMQLIFTKDEVLIWTRDHREKSKVRITLFGNKMNHYYCKEEFEIGISRKDLEPVLSKIDKKYYRVSLFSVVGSTQKTINVQLENEWCIQNHTIELAGTYTKFDYNISFDTPDPGLHITFPCDYFKKLISDMKPFKTINSSFSICKHEVHAPLKIEIASDLKVLLHYICKKDKVQCVCTISDDESFRVTVLTDNVKAISNSCLSDSLDIYCNEGQPLLFVIRPVEKTKKEEDTPAIEIRILTDIEDNRSM